MMHVLAFIVCWLLLGWLFGWSTHSKTVTGKRDDQ
jgi:hypothetical protein